MTGLASALEATTGLPVRIKFELKVTAIEAQAEHGDGRLNVNELELPALCVSVRGCLIDIKWSSDTCQVPGVANFKRAGMQQNLVSDSVVNIPAMVQLMEHEVNPVNIGLDTLKIEVAKILV